jgi:hypothetical protein
MEMLLGIAAAVLLVACLLLASGGCSSRTASGPPPGAAPNRPPVVSTAGMKSLDRAAIRALLKRLADTPAPNKTSTGAMCYSVAPSPPRAEYICPKCGERTLYDDSKLKPEKQREYGVDEVRWEIPACRRELQELRKVAGDAVALDESQFCRKCSPKITEPKLVLHISYAGGKVRAVEKIDHGDLRMLRELLSGELLTTGDNEGTYPLKEFLPRLEELLGVKLDE